MLDDNSVVDAKGDGNGGITLKSGVYIGRNSIVYCKGGDITLEEEVSISSNCVVFSSNKLTMHPGSMIGAYSYLLSVEFGFQRATLATLICALPAGMCLGFLPHNIYPARIFMGDTGSMLIGLLLAAAMITLTGRLDPSALQGVTLFPAIVPLLLPLAVVAVPLTDVVLAVGRRARAGTSPFAADKQHLHHRLMQMGHSQRRAVSLMYGWTALVAFTAVSFAFVSVAVSATVLILGTTVMVLLVRRPAAAEIGSSAAG